MLFITVKTNIWFLDISLEDHVTRDGRKAIDNVDDEAERELKKVNYSKANDINDVD